MRTEYYRVVIKNTPPSNAPCTVIPIVSVTFSDIIAVVDNGCWLPIAIVDIAGSVQQNVYRLLAYENLETFGKSWQSMLRCQNVSNNPAISKNLHNFKICLLMQQFLVKQTTTKVT